MRLTNPALGRADPEILGDVDAARQRRDPHMDVDSRSDIRFKPTLGKVAGKEKLAIELSTLRL